MWNYKSLIDMCDERLKNNRGAMIENLINGKPITDNLSYSARLCRLWSWLAARSGLSASVLLAEHDQSVNATIVSRA